MNKELICIVCPMGCHLEVDIENDYQVTGNQCKRGIGYAKKELTNPTRTITSTVKIKNAIYNRLPVKTDKEVPKNLIMEIMKELDKVVVESPIKVGTILLKNVLGTDVNIVASRSM
jgi:CxxC motif-containing protein